MDIAGIDGILQTVANPIDGTTTAYQLIFVEILCKETNNLPIFDAGKKKHKRLLECRRTTITDIVDATTG